MSGNEFTEKNVAADDPKGLACVAIQEIYSDDEVDNFGHAQIIYIIQ